jgi:hypothetical protein
MNNKNKKVFRIILIAFAIYSFFFIFKTSFDIDGERYFSLGDDQMISMKYAKNLADGHGLVWNQGGDKVEGFTNLLWVLYMAVFHLLPIPVSKISLFIQLSGMLFLTLNLVVLKRIIDHISEGSEFLMVSLFLTAFYFPLNYWSLHGFEVSVLVLLINLAVYFMIKHQEGDQFVSGPFIILGLATLIRMDMVIPYMVIFLCSFLPKKKRSLKNLVLGLLPLVITLGGQTLFRYLYYGEVLPNTFYLKMSGYPILLRITRGLYVFLDFMWRSNWILFLPPFVLLFTKKYKQLRVFGYVILGQILYSIYVGGDSWDRWGACNRFIVVAMPLFFVLLGLSLKEILALLKEKLHGSGRKHATEALVFVLFVLVVFSFNSLGETKHMTDWLLHDPPFEVSMHKWKVELGLYIKKITKPEAKIAVVWAGTMPYFVERNYIDLLGKTDKKIARTRMKPFEKYGESMAYNNPLGTKYTYFFPGHLKWDYSHSIRTLKPDVIVQLWPTVQAGLPYLKKDYFAIQYKGYQLILRKRSRNLLIKEPGSN